MPAADLLGYTAGFLTTFSAAPQLYHSYVRREVRGINMGFQVMLIGGLLLWTVYGVLIHAWPVILFNAVGCSLWIPVLAMTVQDRRRSRRRGHEQ